MERHLKIFDLLGLIRCASKIGVHLVYSGREHRSYGRPKLRELCARRRDLVQNSTVEAGVWDPVVIAIFAIAFVDVKTIKRFIDELITIKKENLRVTKSRHQCRSCGPWEIGKFNFLGLKE